MADMHSSSAPRPPPNVGQYGKAVLAVAVATLLRLALEPVLYGQASFGPYYLALLLVAWCCGTGPTILASALSLASAWMLPGRAPGFLAAAAVFVAVSVAMVLLARVAQEGMKARAHLAAIVESSDDAIITKDLNGIIQSANAGAERLFGYRADELVGRPVTMLIPPEHQQDEAYILERLRRGERVEHFETVRLAKDGTRIDLSLTISPIRDQSGAIVGASKVGRDISERKRAQAALAAQREWLDRTLISIGDAVIATDAEGRIVFMNPVAERLTGWPASEARGQSCDTVLRIVNEATRQPVESPVTHVLRSGNVVGLANSTLLVARDGTERPIDDSGAPIRVGREGGEIRGVVLVFRDISDRRKVEAERREVSQEREHLLESERSARGMAEQASRSKDEFVAMVSHELRNPLSAILGWAHILQSGPADAENWKRGLEVIERNARTQERLVSDLLDMSSIISGKLRLDVGEVDLIALIQAVLETVRPAADARGIAIETTLDPSVASVTGDATRLQQCVWNLLSNAIKFTSQGGRVALALRRSESYVEIVVSDSGMGIRPELLPFVFERFRQADTSNNRRFRGLGLGLAIVKQLVELHGGRVRAASAGEGKGSTFTLALPIRALRTAPAAGAEPPPAITLAQVKILVVEDDLDSLEILRRLLEQHQAQVLVASSAAEALDIVAKERPDVLVSDIGLPGMDGYEMVRRVRQLDARTAGPIVAVALTAHARPDDRTRALRAGFQAHLAKPVQPGELLATIVSLVELARQPAPVR